MQDTVVSRSSAETAPAAAGTTVQTDSAGVFAARVRLLYRLSRPG